MDDDDKTAPSQPAAASRRSFLTGLTGVGVTAAGLAGAGVAVPAAGVAATGLL